MGSELSTVTQPVGLKPPQTADEDAVRVALDLLTTGGCDQSAFLQAMQRRFQSEPGSNWELLSQLDQYYRRGKIKSEMYNAIKAALAGPALGAGNDAVSHATSPAALADAPRRAKEPQPPAASPQLKPGDRLRDRYRIERVLGQGGMGTVFEAVDDYRLEALPSGQRLAIKVLHTAVTTRTELFTELRREFQSLQILSHPNIVRVYEFDRDGPLAFFTMELLNGALLSRVLLARRAPLEHAHALAVLRDVGAAIAYAHSRGVEHGDINPQNIFVTSRGDLRVLDFGSSDKLVADPLSPDTGINPARFATPGYASCQVLEGERPDARDDVFALACVAYRLLCGEHPFSEGSAVDARTAGSHARKPMKLTHRQWRVLREGLHWDREMRPRDVQQWLERLDLRGAAESLPALTDLLDPRPAANSGFGFPKAQALPAVLGLIVVLALAGGGWFVRNYTALPGVIARAPSATAGAPTDIPRAPTDSPSAAAGIAGRTLPPESAREDAARLADSQPAPPSETAVAAPPITPPITPPVATPIATPMAPPIAPPSSASSIPVPPARLAKIEMAAPIVDVPPAEANARVVVRRKGNLRGAIGFTWWTESGTAKPGTDFAPVVPQIAIIPAGETSVTLSIPVTGSSRAQSKNFYVVIDQPEGNAELGAQALAMVSLPPTS
jgi:serine/threonine protein kinase